MRECLNIPPRHGLKPTPSTAKSLASAVHDLINGDLFNGLLAREKGPG
jgi:hypothetical protein